MAYYWLPIYWSTVIAICAYQLCIWFDWKKRYFRVASGLIVLISPALVGFEICTPKDWEVTFCTPDQSSVSTIVWILVIALLFLLDYKTANKPQETTDQSNSYKSETSINIAGDVKTLITGNGHQISIEPESFAELMKLLNNTGLSEDAKTKTIDHLIKQLDAEQLEKQSLYATVEQLKVEVTTQAERVKELLGNPDQATDIRALIEKGDIAAAEALSDQRQLMLAKKSEDFAKEYYAHGEIKEVALKYQEAYEAFKTAAALSPMNTRYLNQVGRLASDLGDYDKAIEHFELALQSDLKTFGEDHPQVAIYRNNLGSAWNSKGAYDKAIEYYELALQSDLNTFGEDHPKVAIRRNNLGLAWSSKGV